MLTNKKFDSHKDYISIIRETYKTAYTPEDGMQITKDRSINETFIVLK